MEAVRDENRKTALLAHSSVDNTATPIRVTADANGNLRTTIGDSPTSDAFGRLRVGAPETLFAAQSQYSAEPIQMEAGNTGTGVAPTHSADTRLVELKATAGTGTSYLQSYQYLPYEPGKSQFIAITGVMGAGVAGSVKDFGYFDANNGIIYRQNGTSGLQIVRRTSTSGSVVDNAVNQASWNLDKLDGTGASGITLDPTKAFILIIDLQFLGMGRIRVGFDINGCIIYAHEFNNANVLSVPYMQTASLPIQALITASTVATTTTSYFKCATVQSEGGFIQSLAYSFSTPSASATAGNETRVHALSVRPRTTFNGIANHSLFVPSKVNIVVTGNNPIFWELVVGATFTVAPSFINVSTTYSAFEFGTGGTFSAIGADGFVVASGYVVASAVSKASVSEQVMLRHPITLNRAGAQRTAGTLSLLVTGLGATSATRASIDYLEIR